MKKITFFATLLAMLVSSVQSAFADDAKWTNKFIKSVADATTDLGSLEDGYICLKMLAIIRSHMWRMTAFGLMVQQ